MAYGLGRVEVPFSHREGERIVCDICPVFCKLAEGQTGLCRGRKVVDGRLIATNYGQVVSLHLDPIEKKPLYHFAPGRQVWSAGPNGCNLLCRWCQNSTISQQTTSTRFYPPDRLARHSMSSESVGLAYTYSEPLIWYETIRDTAPLIHQLGGYNVLVTNGYIEEEPLRELLPLIDAANVDLKFIDAVPFRKYSKGDLAAVQRTIRLMHAAGVHLEITHLVVTGLADSEDHLRRLVDWIAGISPEIPLHISRYLPHHRWQEPPTREDFLIRARELALEALSFVYLGNIHAPGAGDTVCPDCGKLVVERSGYFTRISALADDGTCSACGRKLGMGGTGPA